MFGLATEVLLKLFATVEWQWIWWKRKIYTWPNGSGYGDKGRHMYTHMVQWQWIWCSAKPHVHCKSHVYSFLCRSCVHFVVVVFFFLLLVWLVNKKAYKIISIIVTILNQLKICKGILLTYTPREIFLSSKFRMVVGNISTDKSTLFKALNNFKKIRVDN